MGAKQSTLEKNGYSLQKTTENAAVATKGDDTFLIKEIKLDQISSNPALNSEIDFLKKTDHPHIVSLKNSFKDEDQKVYYIVMDYCQGRNLAAKIREMSDPPQESEVLSWIAEICVALRTIHEKGFLHKRLTLENILLTEFGTVCLGEFGNIHENSTKTPVGTNSDQSKTINYLPPEVFTEATYDAKSDIWSVGCILYELCTQESAFSAETTIKLMPKIISGHYPSLPENFSSELWGILNDIFSKDPQSRPTASEILERPIMIRCLSEKCKTTGEELQTMLNKLRDVADGLERVHQGATIGSLTGGVIGAVGGITSIVGLILTPFTLGVSLLVTGVGIGVGAAGGLTAGASTITNMVNQSSDRKAVRSIIKKIQLKLNTVACWQQEISYILQRIRSRLDSAGLTDDKDSESMLVKLGCIRAGKGLGGVAELVRLVQVINIGKVAAQGARAVRVAEVATSVLSGLFLAADVFFIAMDAKEIHHIRQAKAAREREGSRSKSVSETETSNSASTSDQAALMCSSSMDEIANFAEPESDKSEAQDQSPPIRSEIMRFVHSIRQAADDLQKNVDELKSINLTIPSLEELNKLT